MTQLRALTPAGVRLAAEMLAQLRSGERSAIDMEQISASANSVERPITFEEPVAEDLASRWHLAAWLVRSFPGRDTASDAAAWSWLAVHLFGVLCPMKAGKRKLREDARYLLEAGDYRKSHRHLLAGPYTLLKAHEDDPDSVRGLLATSPDAPGEVYEQLATRKYIITSRAVVTVATRMYFDGAEGKLRRGAGGAGAGSPRRLSDVLQQLELTYDLQQIPADRLLNVLPKEFERFTG